MESSGVGAALKDQRQKLGLSVQDLADRTKIQPRFLEAIEAGDLSPFPGIVFARNFVRQYATALELDPEPLLARLPKLDPSALHLPDAPARPRAQRTRLRNPLWSSLGWGTAALAAIAAASLYHNDAWRKDLWTALTVRVHPQPAAPQPAPVAIEAKNIPPVEPSPVPAAATETTTPVPDAAPQPVPPPAVPAPRPPVAAGPVQVVVTAHEPSWVRVTADNKSAFVGTLHPNETREISAMDDVRIFTGNAGGLTISLNGKTIDPIGPSGQVRTVRLTAEGPELLSKAPVPADAAPADPL